VDIGNKTCDSSSLSSRNEKRGTTCHSSPRLETWSKPQYLGRATRTDDRPARTNGCGGILMRFVGGFVDGGLFRIHCSCGVRNAFFAMRKASSLGMSLESEGFLLTPRLSSRCCCKVLSDDRQSTCKAAVPKPPSGRRRVILDAQLTL
jgi:hypothetical protein